MKTKVIFRPFVGKNYHQQEFKILALGESLYCWEENLEQFLLGNVEPIKDITPRSVGEFLDYKNGKHPHCKWMNTFTKFANAINNKDLSHKECADFWESIMFYNFVQSPMLAPRIPPSAQQFKDSEGAFIEILETYKPDFIIFWGYRLWDNFNQAYYKPENNIHYLEFNGKKYPIFVIPHPSSTALNKAFYGKIQEYMQKLK